MSKTFWWFSPSCVANARRIRGAGAALLIAAVVAQPLVALASPLDSMVKAVKFNDVRAVKKMLAQGVDPNSVDSQGMPLLVLAAREKSNDVAGLLAAEPKIDLEAKDKADENALMLAAINKDDALVKLLIAKGAQVNKTGWTPLHYAASAGDDAIVRQLLDESAYIDASSPNGTTPLMMAARAGHTETVKLLLDEGADMSIKNQLGLTAADFAKQYNHVDIATGLVARQKTLSTQ